MTVISKNLPLAFALISLVSCGTSTLKKQELYTIKTQFSSKHFKDCSLSLTTQANYNAEVRSESNGLSVCGLKAKITRLGKEKLLMSLKVELSDNDRSHKFHTKVIGVLGETMTLTQQKSKLEDAQYTFLIEKAGSL